MKRICNFTLHVCLFLITVFGIGWVLGIPDQFQWSLVTAQHLGVMLGLGVCAVMIKYPYGKSPGLLELVLGITAFVLWGWMSYNSDAWIFLMALRPPEIWIPGLFAVAIMMEALRKVSGNAIAFVVWSLIAYAFFGDHLPGIFQAEVFPATKTITYLYADNNGVPGIVLRVITQLVLPFIIFGKMLDVSGATSYLNNLALGGMGHRRGGPAKVAVVASAAFGSISGSAVANIMSTGIVTIPMMKRAGFKSRYAAAIEAVASNGGQIAPPIMGATAFIIAEFLEISYSEVVTAALIPAVLYFLVVFLQVDGIAVRFSITGLPKSELPNFWRTLIAGWFFLLPIAILIYFLFGLGYNAGVSALYACGALLVLMMIKNKKFPSKEEWSGFIFGSGLNLLPLLLIGAGAGIIMGVLNSTGLAFQLSLMLTQVGQSFGVMAVLIITALICIIMGMGMPTAAVYIVLVAVVAPGLIEIGLVPIAAHLFIFYFGLLSMLTPPVAIASMVAAELAGSNMWRTGLIALQLGIAAYLLPFLWVFNPAVLMEGSTIEILMVLVTTSVAGLLLGQIIIVAGKKGTAGTLAPIGMFIAALLIGSSTLWLGKAELWTLVPALAGLTFYFVLRSKINTLKISAA